MHATKATTIKDVIAIMTKLEEFFQANHAYKHFLPFLYTYKLVTQTIYANLDKFEDKESLEKLDVYFANLYFSPMFKFIESKQKPTPWKQYLSYCQSESCIPIVSVLLGINAHVNSDLLTSIYKLKEVNEHDFFLVNEILEDLSDEVMKYLFLHEHDVFGMGGLFFKHFRIYEFRQTIQKWRSEVWKNKSKLKRYKYFLQSRIYKSRTEQNALKIIGIFNNLLHFKSILEDVKKLNSLQVKV